jgi:hypothetical protein
VAAPAVVLPEESAQKHSGKLAKSHNTMPNDRTQHQTTTRQTRRRAFHSHLGRSLGCPFSTISVVRLAADRGIEIDVATVIHESMNELKKFVDKGATNNTQISALCD